MDTSHSDHTVSTSPSRHTVGGRSTHRTYASVFKSNVDRFKTIKTAGAEVRVLAYSNDRTIEKEIRDTSVNYSHFRSVVPRIKYPEEIEEPMYNIDAGPKKMLVTEVATSPRKLATCFNSTAPRFADPSKKMNDLAYDIENGLVKSGVFKSVQVSPRVISTMTSTTPRDSLVVEKHYVPPYNPPQGSFAYDVETSTIKYSGMNVSGERGFKPSKRYTEVEYDVDALAKETLATSATRSNALAVPFKSPLVRFAEPKKEPFQDKIYDVDAGNKKSLAKSVQDSAMVFASMNCASARTPRPPKTPRGGTNGVRAGETVYNTDVADKAGVYSSVLASPRVISTMTSTSPRFPPVNVPACDNFYDVDAGFKSGVYKSVENSPRRYYAMSTESKRFKQARSDRPDVVYETDCGYKLSLAKEIETSSVKYSNIHSSIPRFKQEKRTTSEDDYEMLLQNPGNIELKFEIRGNTVVKKTSERAVIIVGRQ